MTKSVDEKFQTVIEKNTFYFFNQQFEEKYEGYLTSVRECLLILKNEICTKGLKEEVFEKLLAENANGLTALLALTGFSNESLKRLITLIRVLDDSELARLTFKKNWASLNDEKQINEWSDAVISRKIQEDPFFRKGLVNIFLKGASQRSLAGILPLFELRKLGVSKLSFDPAAMIDTLVRYKEKGSYSGQKDNNAESVIRGVLDKLGVSYDSGDLTELIKHAPDTKRTIDFIIPSKKRPKIILESSFLVTTSSGQGDKSKTEIAVRKLIKKHYPLAKFIGFVDGIGWYVRKEDLRRMVNAYEDVFTFHKSEILRFESFVKNEVDRHA